MAEKALLGNWLPPFLEAKMEIDARIMDGRVQVYRRSDGHALGTLGKANPRSVVSNGEVVAVLNADGTIERYRAHSRTFLGAARHHGSLALAITADSLYVIHRAGLRRYDPETGRQMSPFLVTAPAKPRRTAIRMIRTLASVRTKKAK
jgi:hypothetical protein